MRKDYLKYIMEGNDLENDFENDLTIREYLLIIKHRELMNCKLITPELTKGYLESEDEKFENLMKNIEKLDENKHSTIKKDLTKKALLDREMTNLILSYYYEKDTFKDTLIRIYSYLEPRKEFNEVFKKFINKK